MREGGALVIHLFMSLQILHLSLMKMTSMILNHYKVRVYVELKGAEI